MAVKKIRMRPEGTNDYGDILHPETSADMVIASDGVTTFESHLADTATDANLGHVKVDNDSITVTEAGVISAQKPVDYGRYQAEFGWDGANYSNTELSSGDLVLSTGQTSGTVTKTITPSDLKKWGNLKWTQTTPENTSVVCDVLDASNNVLKAGVTSVADLTDINISQYPSIKTRWTLTRDSVEDESPTVSNPSWTWEGAKPKGVQIASGTWSDTTTSVTANGTYTKTIPLGFLATRGRLTAKAFSRGVFISFTTVNTKSIGLAIDNTGYVYTNLKSDNGYLSDVGFDTNDGYIRITDTYIDGENLIIIFTNTVSSTQTLCVKGLNWEVEG